MPAKSKSPEAAQRKVWQAEMKTLNAADRKICREFRAEQKKLIAASESANRKVLQFQKRIEKQLPRALSKIDSRRAVLRGRLGL